MCSRYNKAVFLENYVGYESNGGILYAAKTKRGGGGDLLYVSIGEGIISGIVLDGKLRRKSWDQSGNIGYAYRKRTSWPGWSFRTKRCVKKSDEYRKYGRITPPLAEYIADTLSPILAILVNTLNLETGSFGWADYNKRE